MKYFFAIWIPVLMFVNVVLAQGTITHKVETGETINDIAKKYQVTPYDIYKLNPDAQRKLSSKMVLLIPSKSAGLPKTSVSSKMESKTSNSSAEVKHKVMPKETLFGIEKKYNISDADLKKANPFLETDGLQIDQILVIPSKKMLNSLNAPIYHDVLPKETKFSIAKKYGITVAELEKKNPEIVSNLTVGYHLLIKGNPVKKTEVVPAKVINAPKYISYEVKPKETLYSLSKMSGMSQEELVALNPELKNGVETGMVIKLPAGTSLATGFESKEVVDLAPKNKSGERKKLALLLPFNVAKVQGDTLNTVASRLKKDKFLNMTLDFYAGALMAIDSAKTLGLPIDVSIYDSEETKNSSNVAAIINTNNLQSADAVIGPFYQNNAEAAARLLSANNVPVISPLSKDLGNPISNLYQTVPTNEMLKTRMFDFMRAKKGNIVAVVDKKKISVIQYLQQNQKDVRLVPLNTNGTVSAEGLKAMLLPNVVNYVLLETANTWMVKTTITALVSAMPHYQVQLVILEPNDTLDSDEISFLNLVKLKLMYPSVTRDNLTPEGIAFDAKFKKLNSITPSDYATRGFDVTFDAMIRLMQNKSFEETVDSSVTEQFENKFEYSKKEGGGYINKGIYIMYYDSDLTLKVAN
ncbi:LysM peptidoglycan-binding domain-containing protein [Flavobacterium flavipallidum]|uniref:LysM peptidoglycan-binding domain-containing protein n=1 Tax=Flavobacterium flavipallidum TaxID=3139140 RepID=A0ABU9HK54_9FLAO